MKSSIVLFLYFLMVTHASAGLNIIVVEGAVNVDKGKNKGEIYKMGQTVSMDDGLVLKSIDNETLLCVVGKLSAMTYFTLKNGEKADVEFVDKQVKNSDKNAFIVAIKTFFLPEKEAYQGGKRLDEKERLLGFPYGSVLKPENYLVIDFDKNKKDRYSNFNLFSEASRKPLLAKNVVGEAINIPEDLLMYGQVYRWNIQRNSKSYEGEFVVAYKEDQDLFEEELASIPHFHTLTPQAKLLLKAIKAKQWQYSYDMTAIAKTLVASGGDEL